MRFKQTFTDGECQRLLLSTEIHFCLNTLFKCFICLFVNKCDCTYSDDIGKLWKILYEFLEWFKNGSTIANQNVAEKIEGKFEQKLNSI